MIFPAFADGTTQLCGFRESRNNLRFFTGLIGGIGLALLIKAFKWYIIKGGNI